MNHLAVGIAWLSGALLIAFGVHGCAEGRDVYAWAVFAGLLMINATSSSKQVTK